MSTFQKIMKSSQRSINRSIYQMNRGEIYPCQKHFCLCVEYLDFGKEKDRNRYKHCFITSDNNAKYKQGNLTYDSQQDTLSEFQKLMQAYV